MLLMQFCTGENKYCKEAVKSAQSVRFCPTSRLEWDSAAKKKNCSKIATSQNCTIAKETFIYHCVINEYRNETLEVCAVKRLIIGYCTEFNVYGGVIQSHTSPCNISGFPKCDQVYYSSDAFKYAGCYELVMKEQVLPSTTVLPEQEKKENHILPAILITFAVVFCAGIAFIFSIFLFRKLKRDKMSRRPSEMEELLRRKDGRCAVEDYCKSGNVLKAIKKGEELRRNVRGDVSKLEDKKKIIEDDTKSFLEAHDTMLEQYVETQLTAECKKQLQKSRVLILTGIEGTGKTITAIHIMNTCFKEWKKLKFTSWEDVLAFDLEERTIIYVDNMLDGFMYRHNLNRWWNAFCYFYNEYIDKTDGIYLLITAKENVVEKACAICQVNIPFLVKSFFVKADLFHFSFEEKLEILWKYLKLAEEREIPEPSLLDKVEKSIKDHNGPIGFPLCAYLYANEERTMERNEGIFNDTRGYVKRQIAYEVDRDKTYRVKTLLLILMFYQSPPGSNYVFDFKYRDECLNILQKDGFKEWVNKLGPFQTEDLFLIAKKFEKFFFWKNLMMHQVYLEGVRDYFISEYCTVAVEHFPLDMLRTSEFQGIPKVCLEKLIERFHKEILRNAVSETLSCKIFGDTKFEFEFCKMLTDKVNRLKTLLSIPDKGSEYELPIIFWAHKYHLNILSKKLWECAEEKREENKDFQFYLGRFGECCENDESYISNLSTYPQDVNRIKTAVFDFRTSEEKSILHMLVSSDKSDYDAHRIMKQVLQDAPENTIVLDRDALIYALRHTKCSRLACILEILNGLNDRSNILEEEETTIMCVTDPLHEAFWKFEMVVRMSLVKTYNEIQPGIACVRFVQMNNDNCYLTKILDGKLKDQNVIAQNIKDCFDELLQSTSSNSFTKTKAKRKSFRKGIRSELKDAFEKSIQIQALYEQNKELW